MSKAYDDEFRALMAGLIAAMVFLFGAFALMGALGDEKKEYFEDGCLVQVHKNNHLFDKDTVKITRYCS